MRSRAASKLPQFILQLLAREAERVVACAPSAEFDINLADVRAQANASGANCGAVIHPTDLVYEVLRQRSNGELIYLQSHMERYGHSLHEVFGAVEHSPTGSPKGDQTGSVVKKTLIAGLDADTLIADALRSIERLQQAHYGATSTEADPAVAFTEQNIKYIAWAHANKGDSEEGFQNHSFDSDAPPVQINTLAFYIHSSYPPKEWYTTGATLALLFGHRRTNPHAKVVYPLLKAKAAEQIKTLGVFESLIVQGANDAEDTPAAAAAFHPTSEVSEHCEDHFSSSRTAEAKCVGLVPEGVRSNYIIVDKNGAVISPSDDDMLVGTTLLAVRDQCAKLGIPMSQRRLTLKDVIEAEAMAMLGTSVNVLPIGALVVSAEDVELPLMKEWIHVFEPFTAGVGSSAANSLCIRKPSGANRVLQRLNAEYTTQTFQ